MCGVDETAVPYLCFVQVLVVCREVIYQQLNDSVEELVPITETIELKHKVPWTSYLERNGLAINDMDQALQERGIVLHDFKVLNRFRNRAVYGICAKNSNKRVLSTKAQQKMVVHLNEQEEGEKPTVDAAKSYLAELLRKENIDETTIQPIVDTVARKSSTPFQNHGQFLHILNTSTLKQRKHRSCAAKAKNMQTVLECVPLLLTLPELLKLEPKQLKDLSEIWPECKKQLTVEMKLDGHVERQLEVEEKLIDLKITS